MRVVHNLSCYRLVANQLIALISWTAPSMFVEFGHFKTQLPTHAHSQQHLNWNKELADKSWRPEANLADSIYCLLHHGKNELWDNC